MVLDNKIESQSTAGVTKHCFLSKFLENSSYLDSLQCFWKLSVLCHYADFRLSWKNFKILTIVSNMTDRWFASDSKHFCMWRMLQIAENSNFELSGMKLEYFTKFEMKVLCDVMNGSYVCQQAGQFWWRTKHGTSLLEVFLLWYFHHFSVMQKQIKSNCHKSHTYISYCCVKPGSHLVT